MTAPLEIRWEAWNQSGVERLVLHSSQGGSTIESRITVRDAADPFQLSYTLLTDDGWQLQEARLDVTGGPSLRLFKDGDGGWRSGSGDRIDGFGGCIDIDISATPFTNTLPIRRLDLPVGSSADVRMLFVSAPALTLSPVEQRYTRVAPTRYRYHGLSTGFETDLEVDQDGIVIDYPGLFRRIRHQ
ncbi:MAG: putative glycolipid-binding domain-containing protein [Pseudomonadota bacterium]